jgi:hypothetical protein
MSRQSNQRTQRALREFKFHPENPIEMKLLTGKPLFEVLARGRVEFHHHLAFLHVDEDALGRHRGRRCETLPQFFRALPREACEGMLRDVTSHSISPVNDLPATNSIQRETKLIGYTVAGEKANA